MRNIHPALFRFRFKKPTVRGVLATLFALGWITYFELVTGGRTPAATETPVEAAAR